MNIKSFSYIKETHTQYEAILHRANRDQGYIPFTKTQHKGLYSIYACMCNKIGLLLLLKIIVESGQVDNKM